MGMECNDDMEELAECMTKVAGCESVKLKVVVYGLLGARDHIERLVVHQSLFGDNLTLFIDCWLVGETNGSKYNSRQFSDSAWQQWELPHVVHFIL